MEKLRTSRSILMLSRRRLQFSTLTLAIITAAVSTEAAIAMAVLKSSCVDWLNATSVIGMSNDRAFIMGGGVFAGATVTLIVAVIRVTLADVLRADGWGACVHSHNNLIPG